MATALDRLKADGRLAADLEIGEQLWQPLRLEGSVSIQVNEVDTDERPALADLVQKVHEPTK